MSVGYITGRYPAPSHTFILREVRALRARGVEVRTFSIRRSGEQHILSDVDREEAAETYALFPPVLSDHVRAHARALLRSPRRYAALLARVTRNAGPGAPARLRAVSYFLEGVIIWWRCERDGVRHLHGEFCGPASDAAMVAAGLGGSGWTWSMAAHGTDIFGVPPRRLASKIRSATFVTCASHFGRTQLMGHVEEHHWAKIEVVRCGVDLTAFRPKPRRTNDGRISVLTVGRLEREKGQSLLLTALDIARRRGVSISATIVGDGSRRTALTEQARRLQLDDAVKLVGAVGQDHIRAYYEDADLFCLSSLGEGVPVVLMEAMACEIPVIAPATMGIPELVRDAVSGRLFVPGDVDSLADALVEFAAFSEERRRAIGAAGRAAVADQFEVGRAAARLHEVLERHVAASL